MRIVAGDNLAAMAALPEATFDMAYLDPPFTPACSVGVLCRRPDADGSIADYPRLPAAASSPGASARAPRTSIAPAAGCASSPMLATPAG